MGTLIKLKNRFRKVASLVEKIVNLFLFPKSIFFIGEPFFKFIGMRRNVDINDLSQFKRVLIVRLDEIGDVVMTTPFLRELRRNLPDAWITLVIKPAVYNLVELSPYVSEVLTYDWRVNERFANLRRHWRALRLAERFLWRRRFDLSILPRFDTDYYNATFVTYFSGASRRVGYSENVNINKKHFNKDYDRLFTHLIKDYSLKHEAARNLDVLRYLGGQVQEERLEVWLSHEDKEFADVFLQTHDFKAGNILVAFAPGAGVSKRMWPLHNFVKLGKWLNRKYNCRIIVIGGQGDYSLGQELLHQLCDSAINAVGQVSLRQTCALLKHCHLYIGNDAGPMHLAAAVSIPVIEISCHPINGSPFHFNSPQRFGPWGGGHHVLQPKNPIHPCSDACTATQAHCILGITVDKVKDTVTKFLS